MNKKLSFQRKSFQNFPGVAWVFSKKKLLEFSSSCVGFTQKKEKKKLFFQNILFQDKLEINEQKIRIFQRKSFQNFPGVAWVFFKKKLLEFSRSCVGFSQKKRKEKSFLSKDFISRQT